MMLVKKQKDLKPATTHLGKIWKTLLILSQSLQGT